MFKLATLNRCALILLVLLSLPVAAESGLTAEERASLLEVMEASRAETEALIARAEDDLFTRKPAEGRWSVAEVLEHIAATEEMLYGMATAALARDADPEAAGIAEAMPVSRLADMVRSRDQRFQAPEALHPTGSLNRDDALARYRAARDKSYELVKTTDAPVKSHTAPGPAGKMTVHHVFAFIPAHNLRHNQQISEALAQLAPAEAAAK